MSQVFPTTSMDISLFYPISDRLHGYYPIFTRFPRACTDITLFWPSSMVLPYFRHPPWTLPHFVAFRTASMDITLFPTVCTDITLVYPLFDRLLGYYPTFFMHLHRTSSLASHRPLTTTRDSLRQRPVPRSRPSRGGQSQQTTSLHSSANRTATVNV